MNPNDATVPTVYDWTDSTVTSEYEWSKPITGCKPASDYFRCNNKGRCRRCRRVKAGNICTTCLQLQHDHCVYNKHIRNQFLTSNTITINNESTNIFPNLLANSIPQHANQVTHSAASHAFTFFDKPVSYWKPVSDCCRCNDKSSCQCCWCVKDGNTCTNRLSLRHSHCTSHKRSWSTSLMSSTTIIDNETINVLPNQLASSTGNLQGAAGLRQPCRANCKHWSGHT